VIHIADAQGDGAGLPRDFGQGGEVGGDKIGAQEQVARGIAAQEQFRGEDKFRALRAGFRIGGGQLAAIGGKITDGRI
jgi:hypothetical protein